MRLNRCRELLLRISLGAPRSLFIRSDGAVTDWPFVFFGSSGLFQIFRISRRDGVSCSGRIGEMWIIP